MSDNDKSGDIYFGWDRLRCMIEVKNKDTIAPSDIKSFKESIENMKNGSHNINCAIFVSLRTNHIDGHIDMMRLDIEQDIPVIYLYAQNDSNIDYSISLLSNLITHNNSDSDVNEMLIGHFTNYKEYVDNELKKCDIKIKEYRNMLKRLEKERIALDVLSAKLNNDYIKIIPDTNHLSNEVDDDNISDETKSNATDVTDASEQNIDQKICTENKENAIACIKETFIKRLLQGYGITQKIFLECHDISKTDFEKFGGYKNLLEEAKYEFCEAIITKKRIEKYKKIKADTGSYPTITDLKLKTELNPYKVRQISRIVGGNIPYKNICKFLDQYGEPEEETEEEESEEKQ
jgi:hypothetical protein